MKAEKLLKEESVRFKRSNVDSEKNMGIGVKQTRVLVLA